MGPQALGQVPGGGGGGHPGGAALPRLAAQGCGGGNARRLRPREVPRGGPSGCRGGRTGAPPGDPRAGGREETIADYSWLDRERSVSIYLKVPGVHALPPEKVRVRFRELSLDVSVDLGSVVKTFAIT